MNAEARELEPDLRSVEAWDYLKVGADGGVDPNVICSWCGRFTVVRYLAAGSLPTSFTAWRRYPREQRRMAEVIGTARDVAAAVEHCVRRAEEEGST